MKRSPAEAPAKRRAHRRATSGSSIEMVAGPPFLVDCNRTTPELPYRSTWRHCKEKSSPVRR
eukprot:5262115-Amphidinium_carterae.1